MRFFLVLLSCAKKISKQRYATLETVFEINLLTSKRVYERTKYVKSDLYVRQYREASGITIRSLICVFIEYGPEPVQSSLYSKHIPLKIIFILHILSCYTRYTGTVHAAIT
jgi:hypothetical protein